MTDATEEARALLAMWSRFEPPLDGTPAALLLAALVAEVERLTAERNARPEITPEDAALAMAGRRYYDGNHAQHDAFDRVEAALEAHAAKVKP